MKPLWAADVILRQILAWQAFTAFPMFEKPLWPPTPWHFRSVTRYFHMARGVDQRIMPVEVSGTA